MGFPDSNARMFPVNSVPMSPDRHPGRNATTFPVSNATMCQDSSVTTFLASNVATFRRRSVPTSPESNARTFPASSASRCPSRSVRPPSQPTELESREENSFLNTLSLSPPAPNTPSNPLHPLVDFENILVNSILCHLSLSAIFMSALFKHNMRHSEIYKEIAKK